MGKGDKKSKKGKRFKHSFGKTRLRNKNILFVSAKKVEEKPKAIEVKKIIKPEQVPFKPVVVETKTEEIKIEQPVVVEVKEEVMPPVIELPAPVKEPEAVVETKKEEIKKAEPKKVSEPKKAAVKEDTKKRGRPKKK